MFFLKKNNDFQGSTLSFFHVFSMIFRSFFDIEFCIDFFMILDAISAPFSIPFRPFGHHFGILFRHRFFHDFWMPFWMTFGSKSTHPTAIPSVTFFKKKSCFFWASIWHRFLMDFDSFLVGFCMDFHEIWTHFGASGFFFRSFWFFIRSSLASG